MILLLTPLRLEHDALLAALTLPQRREEVGGHPVVVHGDRVLATAVGGHGKVEFALRTSFLCEQLAPALVVCAGACGGLAPELSVGDVVVANETIEHDFNLRFVQRPLPCFAGDSGALGLAGRMDFGSRFQLHIGRIASGDEDVMSSERGLAIRALTLGALAVAWEGAGGARAARFQGRPFVEVRGVTDLAGGTAAAEFAFHLREAMANVAAVVQELL